jgi:histidine triad (HIT) family protein
LEGCIFCRIVQGSARAAVVYQDEKVLCFLDINPVAPGHTLVIPRGHYETLLDVFSDSEMGALGKGCRIIGAALMKALGAKGFNVMMNNLPAAGQLVPHAHFHVVPRFPGDGLRHWPGTPTPPAVLEKVAEKLRKAL